MCTEMNKDRINIIEDLYLFYLFIIFSSELCEMRLFLAPE